METTRQEKIAKMLQKEFGDIFLIYARNIKGILISVSEVRITSDLSIARIYLSIFPNDKANEIIKRIESDAKALRYELGRRLKNHLRIIPELTFYLDESIDKLSRIDEILKADEHLHDDFEEDNI